MILATPLTICLVVLGRYVDRLKFLDVMFGDEPALTPAELVYQRMLARDPVEAAEQARNFLKQKPLLAYYDEVLVPGLGSRRPTPSADCSTTSAPCVSAMRSRKSSTISARTRTRSSRPRRTSQRAKKRRRWLKSTRPKSHSRRTRRACPSNGERSSRCLCIPGLGLLDEAVALMVAQLIERDGIGARVEQADALSVSRIFSLDTKDVALVCLCYVESATSAQVDMPCGGCAERP